MRGRSCAAANMAHESHIRDKPHDLNLKPKPELVKPVKGASMLREYASSQWLQDIPALAVKEIHEEPQAGAVTESWLGLGFRVLGDMSLFGLVIRDGGIRVGSMGIILPPFGSDVNH